MYALRFIVCSYAQTNFHLFRSYMMRIAIESWVFPCLGVLEIVVAMFGSIISVSQFPSLITHHSSIITQNTLPVWNHHSLIIIQYFSHYLWVPYLSLGVFFFFFQYHQTQWKKKKKKEKKKRNPNQITEPSERRRWRRKKTQIIRKKKKPPSVKGKRKKRRWRTQPNEEKKKMVKSCS